MRRAVKIGQNLMRHLTSEENYPGPRACGFDFTAYYAQAVSVPRPEYGMVRTAVNDI